MSAAETPLVNITVNGTPLQVPKGELVVEAIKRLGLEIPIFCYHSRLKPVGMCRMCLVEVGSTGPDGSVRMMPKPQASCTLACTEGLVINTDTEKIHADRKGVLEFLLINHPLDCPICDRGGECPLQNNTLFYGPSTSRFVEVKRHNAKAYPLSQHVKLDLERCIQCGRCVRFTEEISGDAQLGWRFRGAQMHPATYDNSDFDSKFSGNVIEICPVGALTSAHYRFRARPWDLESTPSVCTECSNGCNTWFDHRLGKMARINGRTNEAINEEWTCDRGKFGHEYYNSEDRLATVLRRAGDKLEETTWGTVYKEIPEKFAKGGAILFGPKNSNQDATMLSKLFIEGFGSRDFDYRMTRSFRPSPSKIEATIASLEEAKAIFVFGTSLADDLPIVYLRARKAWFNKGAKIAVASIAKNEVDALAEQAHRYEPGKAADFLRNLPADLKAWIKANQPVFVSSDALMNEVDGAEAAAAFEALAAETGSPCSISALHGNDQGLANLGIGAGDKNTRQILEACAGGKIDALWLAGVDPLVSFPDKDLARRALEKVGTLVVQGIQMTEAVHYGSYVLPQTAPAEAEGSYTNCEGQVQHIKPALPAKGSAKPAWMVANDILFRVSGKAPFATLEEVPAGLA